MYFLSFQSSICSFYQLINFLSIWSFIFHSCNQLLYPFSFLGRELSPQEQRNSFGTHPIFLPSFPHLCGSPVSLRPSPLLPTTLAPSLIPGTLPPLLPRDTPLPIPTHTNTPPHTFLHTCAHLRRLLIQWTKNRRY